jgi:hypothetical protein
MPGRYHNLYGLVRTFAFIKLSQLLSQPKRFHPDNGVRGLVEGLSPAENVRRDGILLDGAGVAIKVSFANVFKEVG